MESKWYVIVETAPDGKDYVGINDDSYCGDGIISEHGSELEADAACIEYAQESGLPLNDDSYCGDGIISEHGSELEADAACIKYAQESGLPLFADYREDVSLVMACPQCGNRDMDMLIMDDQDYCTCQSCGTVYDPLKKDYREAKRDGI